jgi:hypothetical protein
MTIRLFAGQFQTAYLTADVDQGMAYFRDNFAIRDWTILNTAGPGASANAIAIAYSGETMIELIEPSAEPSLYQNWLPAGGSGLRFHHLGFLVHSDQEWQATIRMFQDRGYPTVSSGTAEGLMDYHYADSTAVLGHYLELIHLQPGGEALFASVPRN